MLEIRIIYYRSNLMKSQRKNTDFVYLTRFVCVSFILQHCSFATQSLVFFHIISLDAKKIVEIIVLFLFSRVKVMEADH